MLMLSISLHVSTIFYTGPTFIHSFVLTMIHNESSNKYRERFPNFYTSRLRRDTDANEQNFYELTSVKVIKQ